MWIGTIDGLNRYDGYTCTVFRHDPSNPRSISSSFIHHIFEDRYGMLWVSTRDGGLNRFDPATESFMAFRHNPADSTTLSSDQVGYITEDSTHLLWIATATGLNRFDPVTGKITRYVRDPHNSSTIIGNDVTGILPNPNGTVWVSTDEGLCLLDTRTGVVERYGASGADPRRPAANELLGLLRTRDGNLWIGSRLAGLFVRNEKTGVIRRFSPDRLDEHLPSSEYVNPFVEDEDGRIWLQTHNGVNVFEPSRTGGAPLFYRISLAPNGAAKNVSAICRDRAGDIWVGTWGDGVYHIARRRMKFAATSSRTHAGLLASDFVLSFLDAGDSRLWVGTSNGISILSSAGSSLPAQHLLPGSVIWCMIMSPESTIWVGGHGKGLRAFRRNGTPAVHPPAPLDATVRALFRAANGILWAGTQERGVCSYDPSVKRWTSYPFSNPDLPEKSIRGVGDSLVWAINQDLKGDLWFGTYRGGVTRFDPTRGTFHRHRAGTDSTSLGSNDVRSICVTHDGQVWIGTYGGGIARWQEGSDDFRRFTQRDGLANDFVYGIVEDSEGLLWISTNHGISRFDPARRTSRTYIAADGLQADEFNTGAYGVSRTGELLFGGVSGFNRFLPVSVRDNPEPPPVVLTSFKVFETARAFDRPLSLLDTVTLRYDENFFSFEFAALDFVDQSRNRYAYMLENFDPHWNYSGTRRYGSYTNLDPGSYILHIKASNSDGVWNETGRHIRIVIVPPFWMTAWFRLLAFLVAVGIFTGVVRYFSTRALRMRLREMEKERALQEERERISRDLHDNVGSQLSTIIAGLELAGSDASGSVPSPDPGARSRDLLAALKDDARLTMAQLRETIWAMSSPAMTVTEFFETVEAYGKRQVQTRSVPRVEFTLACRHELSLSPMQVLHLFRIVQEALNNALKHSGGDCVSISMGEDGAHLLVRVADNGVSQPEPDRARADDLSGRGLLNMERRARELGGTLAFRREGGMTVEVRIPLDAKYLK